MKKKKTIKSKYNECGNTQFCPLINLMLIAQERTIMYSICTGFHSIYTMVMRISEYISTYSAAVLAKANNKPYPIQVRILYLQYYVPGCWFSEETCVSPIFLGKAGNINAQCESVDIIFGWPGQRETNYSIMDELMMYLYLSVVSARAQC